jgi:hypothetical protein
MLPHDGVTERNLVKARKPLGLARRNPGVRRVEDEEIIRNPSIKIQRRVLEQDIEVRTGCQTEHDVRAEFDLKTVARASWQPGRGFARSVCASGLFELVLGGARLAEVKQLRVCVRDIQR